MDIYDVSQHIAEVQKQLASIKIDIYLTPSTASATWTLFPLTDESRKEIRAEHQEQRNVPHSDAQRQNTPPTWPVELIEEGVELFFRESSPELTRCGLQLSETREEFNVAVGAHSQPTPSIPLTREDCENWGIDPDRRDSIFREEVPFYIGCSSLRSVVTDPGHSPLRAILEPRSDTMGVIELGRTSRSELQDRLWSVGKMAITKESAASFLSFAIECDSSNSELEVVVEQSDDLPTWLEGTLRSVVASRLRPPLCLSDARVGAFMVIAMTLRQGDLILSLWTIDERGQTKRLGERMVLANPKSDRARGSADHIRPLFKWNLAFALHEDEFEKELAKLKPYGTYSGAGLWRTLLQNAPRPPSAVAERQLVDDEYARIRMQLEARQAGFPLPSEIGGHNVYLRTMDTSFYKDCCLYTIEARNWRARFISNYRCGATDIWPVVLNGTSPPIFRVNRRLADHGELEISSGTTADYLRFFCTYVHAELGAFTIVDSTEDLDWRHITHNYQKELDPLVWPVTLIHADDSAGEFVLVALVSYARDLSVVLFKVTAVQQMPSAETAFGVVEMLTDMQLLVDLPIYPRGNDADLDTAFEVMG